jgi:CHAT domain-containing protein/tetratricopeptide (TPR) repeat protein
LNIIKHACLFLFFTLSCASCALNPLLLPIVPIVAYEGDWQDYQKYNLGNAFYDQENFYASARLYATFLGEIGMSQFGDFQISEEQFSELNKEVKERAIDVARERVQKRFYPIGFTPTLVAILRLSDCFHRLGKYDRAISTIQLFIETIEPGRRYKQNLPKVLLSASYQAYRKIGRIYLDKGDFDKAFYYASKSLAKHEQMNSINEMGCDYRLLSDIYITIGQLGRAKEMALKAVQLHEQGEDNREFLYRSSALSFLFFVPITPKYGDIVHVVAQDDILLDKSRIADILFLEGKFNKSFNLRHDLIRSAAACNLELTEANQNIKLADCFDRVGETQKALELLKKAETLYRKLKIPKKIIDVLLRMAGLATNEKDGDAERYLSEARDLSKNLGSIYFECIVDQAFGDYYFRIGDFEKSREYYVKSLSKKRRMASPYMVREMVLISYIDSNNKKLPFKQEDVQRFLAKLKDPEERWRLELYWGKVLEAQGDLEAALVHYNNSAMLVEFSRENIGDIGFRRSFFGDRLEPYYILIRKCVEKNDQSKAFMFSELSKSRTFLDLLQTKNALMNDRVTLSERTNMNNRVKAYRDFCSGRYFSRGRFDTKSLTFDLPDPLLSARAISLVPRKKVSEQNEEIQRIDSVTSRDLIRDPADILDILDKQTDVIEYFYDEKGLIIFHITRNGISVISSPIMKEDLEYLVDRFMNSIKKQSGEFRRVSPKLYDILIAPVKKKLRKNIIIIPFGCLNKLPFEALLENGQFFGENAVISYTPSLTILDFIRKPRNAYFPMLALGNPVQRNSSLFLPGAEAEVESIASEGVDIRKGLLATESFLKAGVSKYRSIHLATHAFYESGGPAFVLLAKDSTNDGILTMREIADLKLNCEIVVISACRSGVGDVLKGEEIISISRAFLYAGSSYVISALWDVDDQSTSKLFTSFYRYLRAGYHPPEALQMAKREVRISYPEPYYWSAFVIQGFK